MPNSYPRKKIKVFVWLSVISILLCSCVPTGQGESRPDAAANWKVSDLKWFRDAEIKNPQATLAAVYIRFSSQDLEVRIDLLNLQDPLAFDVYLVLDTRPGGSSRLPGGQPTDLAWDTLLIFPAQGQPYALSPDGSANAEIIPRIIRDPFLDCLVIQVNQTALPGDPGWLRSQVLITAPGGNEPLDQTSVISTSSHFSSPAQVLLSFWNTLPAATPAQALRRWDGAHTGPSGQRHGLAVLLKAASDWKIPLFLLDLKNPDSLAVLGLVGGLKWVQALEQKGLVSIPEVAVEDGTARLMNWNNGQLFRSAQPFPTSLVNFAAFQSPLPASGALFFASLKDKTHAVRWQDKIILPLPSPVYLGLKDAAAEPQVSPDGLALAIKKALLEACMSKDPGRLVVLGGDLNISSWANFDTAGLAMQYLANHPWIKILNSQDLQQLPAPGSADWPPAPCLDLLCSPQFSSIVPISNQGTPIKSGLNSNQIKAKIQAEILSLPDTTEKNIAWFAFIKLTNPSTDPGYTALQANYLGSLGYLLEAARWKTAPYVRVDCSSDFDWDGEPECVLSSQNVFSIIKPSSGCLVMLDSLASSHPAIMPTSMVSIGLGDPSLWKLDLGTAADPDALQGAFCFSGAERQNSPPQVGDQSIRLEDTIEYQVNGSQFLMTITKPASLTGRIPFLLLIPGMDYSSQITDLPGFIPGTKDLAASLSPIKLRINPSPISFRYATSFDSLSYLDQPEIPDRSNPAGHFIPFPFAFLNLQMEEPTVLTINFP